MYLCILDATGQVLVHRNVPSTPAAFLETVAPYRDHLVVAAACMFTWYWLADLCAAEHITFVLGHALAMKAIHGGKAKNDKIDSHKIAVLLGNGALEYAFPPLERLNIGDSQREPLAFLCLFGEPIVPILLDARWIIGLDVVHRL